MSKQTAVKLIFEKFNLLSDADFKTWMLMNSELLEAMEKEQMIQFGESVCQDGFEEHVAETFDKTYGGK